MEPPSPSLQPLTFEEARVLGCLIEKERTTPEYYPLTLNQAIAACNQSSNREPVVSLEERTVLRALEGLRERQLAYQVTLAGARVQKYKHNVEGKFPRLEKPTSALLCVLLLRGQQTAGELRQRTERLHAFADLPAVDAAMKELMDYPEWPLAVQLPPGGGRKTTTYMHLLCGPVEAPAPLLVSTLSGGDRARITAPHTVGTEDERAASPQAAAWERLERELQELRGEVAELRRRVAALEGGPEAEVPEAPETGSIYIP